MWIHETCRKDLHTNEVVGEKDLDLAQTIPVFHIVYKYTKNEKQKECKLRRENQVEAWLTPS